MRPLFEGKSRSVRLGLGLFQNLGRLIGNHAIQAGRNKLLGPRRLVDRVGPGFFTELMNLLDLIAVDFAMIPHNDVGTGGRGP